jgi:hypothetical protein
MPDFDTRRPQDEGQGGDAATRDRVASIANKVRTLLMANKLRAVSVGGVLLVVAAAVPLWLLTHSASTHSASEASDLPADPMVCKAPTLAAVDRQTICVSGFVVPRDWGWDAELCDAEHLEKTGECTPPDGPHVTCEGATWYQNAECDPPGSSPDGILRCIAPTREVVSRTDHCWDQQWIEEMSGDLEG